VASERPLRVHKYYDVLTDKDIELLKLLMLKKGTVRMVSSSEFQARLQLPFWISIEWLFDVLLLTGQFLVSRRCPRPRCSTIRILNTGTW